MTVVAPTILPGLREVAQSDRVGWIRDQFAEPMLEGQRLVVAASDDRELNLRIARAAERRGVLCCNVSAGGGSRVIFPAVCSAGGVTVAVHSDGHDCRRSQRIRDEVAAWLADAADGKPP